MPAVFSLIRSPSRPTSHSFNMPKSASCAAWRIGPRFRLSPMKSWRRFSTSPLSTASVAPARALTRSRSCATARIPRSAMACSHFSSGLSASTWPSAFDSACVFLPASPPASVSRNDLNFWASSAGVLFDRNCHVAAATPGGSASHFFSVSSTRPLASLNFAFGSRPVARCSRSSPVFVVRRATFSPKSAFGPVHCSRTLRSRTTCGPWTPNTVSTKSSNVPGSGTVPVKPTLRLLANSRPRLVCLCRRSRTIVAPSPVSRPTTST